MKISFVIPAHNEEKLIGQCLASVFKEIERTRREGSRTSLTLFEVVVVDNASTDRTREEALKFKNVTVVRENLKGLVYARRAGWVATDGDIVANIDADTMLPPGWLQKVMTEFEKDKNLVALTGPYSYYDFNTLQNIIVKVWYFPGWLFNLISQPLGRAVMLQGGNFVLRRDAWERAGGFDTSIAFYGEDADVARRISKYGKVLWTWRLPMYTSARRLKHEGFLTTGWHYFANIVATHVTGRPATRDYTDIRVE